MDDDATKQMSIGQEIGEEEVMATGLLSDNQLKEKKIELMKKYKDVWGKGAIRGFSIEELQYLIDGKENTKRLDHNLPLHEYEVLTEEEIKNDLMIPRFDNDGVYYVFNNKRYSERDAHILAQVNRYRIEKEKLLSFFFPEK